MTIVFDPTKPLRLFDGAIDVYSTCRGCGETMKVLSPYVKMHPTCQDKPTDMDILTTQWLTALMHDEKSKAARLKRQIEVLERKPPDLHREAVRFTAWGWPVFPLARHSKQPAIPKSKGGQGFKQANTDAVRIDKWWAKHPDHNIGLATGHTFDVIDIDPRHSGVESFMDLLGAKNLPEIHGIAVTASGGMHLYVRPTGKGNFAGGHHKGSTSEQLANHGFEKRTPVRLPIGIDYRGRGGYVVGPPSTLGAPGREYSWLIVPSPMLKGSK
jgi:Bifunctional DNA primase/polymerase, N-terminal